MCVTGKYIFANIGGRTYALCNQRSREWTHAYPWRGNRATLQDAGCGIFSIFHAAQYLRGSPIAPEALADFALHIGARGSDGTDRPILLHAMEQSGLSQIHGFSCLSFDLSNDLPALRNHLAQGGAALCNLRPGHITALIGCREQAGESQVLAVDSFSESADPRVRNAVRECVPGSETVFSLKNETGLVCGAQRSYALYWAALSAARDFSLLHRLHQSIPFPEERRGQDDAK